MKILVRVAIAVAVLLGVGLAALALYLPRLVETEAARERIRTRAAAALGREVRYETLDLRLLPPSLVVRDAVVAGETGAARPFLEADAIALRVALLPLLARAVVVDSLVVEGATLRVTRTRDGLVLPRPTPTEDAPPEEAPGGGIDLAVRSVALEDGTLVLRDRAVSPETTWELRDLEARARGSAMDAPFDFEGSFALAGGGRVSVEGKATPGGPLDATVRLDAFALEPLGPYLPKDLRARGTLGGTATVSGPAASPDSLALDLSLRDADVARGDASLRGGLRAKADLEGGLATPRGSFEVDGGEADIRYGDQLAKPPGTRLRGAGRVETRDDGTVVVRFEELDLKDLDASGVAELGPRTRVTLDAPAFELAGWEDLLPALAEFGLAGRVRPEGLRIATGPLEVHGTVHLEEVAAQRAAGGAIRLDGALVGEGDAVRGRDLAARVGGQRIGLRAALTGLAGRPRYDVGLETDAAEANPMVTALAGRPELLFGLLDLSAQLAGGLEEGPLATADGSLSFGMGEGRLAGVSPLKMAFSKLAGAGGATLAAGTVFAVPGLEDFYGDRFDSFSGSFRVQDGVARTSDVRLAYPHYSVDLSGSMDLATFDLDMRGKLTIDSKIDGVLQKAIGRVTSLKPATARPRVIPLVRVAGRPDSLQIQPDLGFATALLSGQLQDQLGNLLGDALGGKRRRKEQEAAPPPGEAPAPEETPAPEPAQDPTQRLLEDALGELLK